MLGRVVSLALVLVLSSGLACAQQSTIGGRSSRPKFQSITVTGDANLSTIDGIAVSDFARISPSNTFRGTVQTLSNSGTPRLCLIDESNVADVWFLNNADGDLRITANGSCSTTGATHALAISSTGSTVDLIALNGSALTWNGSTLFTTANDGAGSGLDADLLDGVQGALFARLDQAANFAGDVISSAVSPRLTISETDAAVDNRTWRIGAQNGTLFWGTRNSADNGGEDFLEVSRTGTNVDSINLQADAVTVNGQGVCLANGTNCPPAKIRAARFGDTSVNGGCSGCTFEKLGTGQYRITWGSSLLSPTCTVSSSGTNGRSLYPVIQQATPSSGNVVVHVFNGVGGVLTDITSSENIQVVCVGM